MADPRPSVIERLSVAMASDDLTMDKLRRGDADYLAALGATTIGRPAGANALIRLALTGDKGSAAEVLRYARLVAARLSERRGWALKLREIEHVARKAIEYHQAPSCPLCNGRGYKSIPGAPSLSEKPCERCHGSGQRPLPLRHGRQIAEVLHVMQVQVDLISVFVRDKLGR